MTTPACPCRPMDDARAVAPATDRLPRSLAVGWGSGAYCQAIATYAFGVLLFRYLTDTAAVGAALVGTMIALSKIYDAAINPLIGMLSDRIATPMGRRRPWMLIGGVLMAASMVMLFNVPGLATGQKIAWISVGLL